LPAFIDSENDGVIKKLDRGVLDDYDNKREL